MPTFGVHADMLHLVYGNRYGRTAWRAFDGTKWDGDVYFTDKCGGSGVAWTAVGEHAGLFCPDGVDVQWARLQDSDW